MSKLQVLVTVRVEKVVTFRSVDQDDEEQLCREAADQVCNEINEAGFSVDVENDSDVRVNWTDTGESK